MQSNEAICATNMTPERWEQVKGIFQAALDRAIPSTEGPRCCLDHARWVGTRDVSRSQHRKNGQAASAIDFATALRSQL
jgi:hypothetical protein